MRPPSMRISRSVKFDADQPRRNTPGGYMKMQPLISSTEPATDHRGHVVQTVGPEGAEIDGRVYQNFNLVEFDGRRFIFSHRAILTLVVIAACNAGCKFCSNEITFTPSGPYLSWNARLARVKEFAQLAGVTKIAYTGGEPTLHPQKFVDLVTNMSRGFARSRAHTNGWGLFKPVEVRGHTTELLPALINAGLTGISISVAHHDPGVNRQVMALPRSWGGMSDAALSAVAECASDHFTPRLSCVLTEDGVSSVDDIIDYLTWGRRLGFRKFIFRTCSEIPDGFKKATDFSAYNDSNARSIEPISREFQDRLGAELVYRQRKSDSKVDVFKWEDVTVDIDESSEEEDPDPKIRRLNVMPDGVTYTSWISPTSNLFDDERPIVDESITKEKLRLLK
ncbi:radical SAM protein [Kribbella sp. NPDC056345]|uniref:radical SAM protein n=1 Tax=Kribbella sp. NPDC056345 TaxID=3345789 RepID=UPI0035D82EA6